MNVPIIKGTPEPKFGDRQELELANAKYNEPSNLSFNEQQAGLKETFFGNNNSEKVTKIKTEEQDYGNEYPTSKGEELQDNQETQELIKQRKIDENPKSPLIDGFVSQRLLSPSEGDLVKEALVKEGDITENIMNLDGVDLEKIHNIISSIEFLDCDEAKELNKQNFNKDFNEEVTVLKEVVDGGKEGELELIGQNKDLVDKIGGNYFSLEAPGGGKETRDEAIDRAFKTTLNELMDGKEFNRPDTFDAMLSVVRNPELSFNKRFEELKKVDTLITDDQSRANGRQSTEFGTMKKGVEKGVKSLEKRFNEFKDTVKVAIESKDYKKLTELLEVATELKDESIETGDVFISGDIDVVKEDIQETLKEQA